jgi:hypothetical protein
VVAVAPADQDYRSDEFVCSRPQVGDGCARYRDLSPDTPVVQHFFGTTFVHVFRRARYASTLAGTKRVNGGVDSIPYFRQ